MIPLNRHDLTLLHILSSKKLFKRALKATKQGAELFPSRYQPHLHLLWSTAVEVAVQSKKDGNFLEFNKQDLVAKAIDKLSTLEMLEENLARFQEVCLQYVQEKKLDEAVGAEYLEQEVEASLCRQLSKAINTSKSFDAIKKLVQSGDELKQSLSEDTKITLFENPLLHVADYLHKKPKLAMGVKHFDKATNGGMAEGEIALVAGLTGGGKTQHTIECVGSQLLMNNNVAWFTYEQSFDQDLMQRMVSFITGYELDYIRGVEYADLPEEVRRKFSVVVDRVSMKLMACDFSSNVMLDKNDPDDDGSTYSIRKRFKIWEASGQLPDYVFVDWLGAAVKIIAAKRGIDIGQVTNFIAIANEFITDLVDISKKYKTRVIFFHQLDPNIKKSPPSRKPTSVELQFIKSASNWVNYAIVIGKRDENQRCWYICDKCRNGYPSEHVVELLGNYAKFKLLSGYAPGRNGQFINVEELQEEMSGESVEQAYQPLI